MAVNSTTTAGPQPQARSRVEDGRARLSCFARNVRIARRGRKSQTSRCGIEAGDPEQSRGSASRRLIRQQQAAKERWFQAVKESLVQAVSPAITESRRSRGTGLVRNDEELDFQVGLKGERPGARMHWLWLIAAPMRTRRVSPSSRPARSRQMQKAYSIGRRVRTSDLFVPAGRPLPSQLDDARQAIREGARRADSSHCQRSEPRSTNSPLFHVLQLAGVAPQQVIDRQVMRVDHRLDVVVSCSGLRLSAAGLAIIANSGSRSVRLSSASGSRSVIPGSR